MILRGLKAINGFLDKQHEENLTRWYAEHTVGVRRNRNPYSDDDADYELELTGYQAVGAAGDYFEVPNR